MIAFAFAAAVLIALALLFLLPALLHRRSLPAAATDDRAANLAILQEQLAQLDAERAAGSLDEEQHRLGRAEIEQRALEESAEPVAAPRAARSQRTALVVALAVPLLALGLYARLGNLQGLAPAVPPPQAAASGAVTMAQVEQMVDQLAQRLQAQPDDLKGWTMLGRSYSVMQRYTEAAQAFSRAAALAPQDAGLLADQAEVLAMAQGQSTLGEPMVLIERALRLDPDNLKALAMAGSAAFERRDFAAAAGYWSRALPQAPPGSELAQGLTRSIAEARAALPAGAASVAAATPAAPAASAGAQVSGRITLAPALAAQVAPGDTLFIFARAAEGPRMPLAILRRSAADLPLDFTLDDSAAMSPAFKLSSVAEVVIGARISKRGVATPTPGDLTAQSAPLKVGSRGVALVIDTVQP